MIVKNGMVWSMEEQPRIMDIKVEHGKIVEMGENLVGDEIIDATGKFVFPGFIDAHCHIGIMESGIGFEGDDGNEITDPITPQLRAIDGINPMDEALERAYQAGITTVSTGPGSANAIGGQFVVMKTYGDRIDDMIVRFPSAMKAAFGENIKRCYEKSSVMTRMGIANKTREALFLAKEYDMKKQAADGDMSKMPPFNMKYEALIPVLHREIPFKCHAHRADDIFTAIRIAKEFDLDLTLEHVTEGHLIAKHLGKEGYPVNVGPTMMDKPKFEMRNLSFETPGVLAKEGLRVSIITDMLGTAIEYLPIYAAMAVKSGMDEYEAYKAISINPALTLGVADRVGSLKAGKDADIVIWNDMPFNLYATVDTTIMDGQVVYHKG